MLIAVCGGGGGGTDNTAEPKFCETLKAHENEELFTTNKLFTRSPSSPCSSSYERALCFASLGD
jgi:hypothetical protein